jgi:pimeloyl-ACP methyl ester carboxylesterase
VPAAALNGVTLHYEVGGTGPAVLLTHGFGETLAMWAGQRKALEPAYRVVTWDMRGHGGSDAPDDPAAYSHEATVGDMRALLDHLGLARAVIGGLSLGGTMALAFHRAHPERVRALVVCASGPGYRRAEAREAWNRRAHARADGLAAQGRAGLAHAARGMLAQRDAAVIDSLPSIRVPTLVVVGDRDEPFLAPARYMAARIPGARLEVVEGAGHMANLDRPEAFDRVLLDFLASLP